MLNSGFAHPISVTNKETHSLNENNEAKKQKQNYGTSSFDKYLEASGNDPQRTATPRYPVTVILVLLSKCFEAFAANGVRSILALYLRDSLHFDERLSTAILHTFNFVSQFLPIVGAILADSYLGNAKTVFIFCIPYAFGYIGSLVGSLPLELVTHSLIYTSLLLIAIGNGCLRACLTALGAHQFVLPQEQNLLDRYFGLYYFFYYAGILAGKIFPSYVRSKVHIQAFCGNEEEDCYPSSFALILLVFTVSWIIFLCGLPFYKREYVTGENTMMKTFSCIFYAGYRKITRKSKGNSWLEGALHAGRFTEEFVVDVSIFLRIVGLFAPIPIYYALLVQQDSTWTYQASQMDTNIAGFNIAADQFKAIGPILMLALIPAWQKILNSMERHGVHITSLESVSLGGICAGLSFVYCGFLQLHIDAQAANDHLPSILWQFPSFLLIMAGEVLISVPGLKFCYTFAPNSMKSALTAVWFIQNAMGNLIVVVFSQLRIIENKSLEYFFYSLLMFLATIIFTLLSERYQTEVNRHATDEQTFESFTYADALTSSNLEENLIEPSDSDDERRNSTYFC